MRVSVLIATYNRAALLDECLDHLSRQPFADGDEIFVVDNGSTDATPEVVIRRQASFRIPLHYLEESRPGKSVALSRAVAVASGDVLVFTDDDVNVGASWLEAIRAAMIDGRVALVGGPVAPRWERRKPWWLKLDEGSGRLAAPLALLDYGPDIMPLGTRTVLGANMAVRHDVIRRLGGFAAHLGKLRGTLLSGEDHELCRRVQAAGFVALYLPSAVVRHWVPASRLRLSYCLRWFFWSGITNAALDESQGRRDATLIRVPRYLVRRFLTACAAAPALAVSGRITLALDRAIDLAFAAGYAASRWGLVRHTRPSPSPAAGQPA
jgi:glycosyltransferase involved in cell wall biosynthesis